MAQTTRKKKETTYQDSIKIDRFIGYSSQLASTLGIGELQGLNNVDLYYGADGDYIKTRTGSQYLKKASGAAKRGATAIVNQIAWDIGSEEYLITQEGNAFYSQALITTGNPVLIALVSGSAFTLGSTARADLFISGDKLYILHTSGNYVIRWNGSAFIAYTMGMAYPWIATVTSATSGAISGSYTLGIEKVYQASGVDLMASTPNRRIPTTRILAQTGTITSKKIKVTIQATELDNDSLWTHVRLWRSKNKNADITDIINPIDAQGNDDELYEEALITRAEFNIVALTAIATSSTLPLGNAGTTAGGAGYAVNAASGGRFSLSALTGGTAFNSKTLTITDTVTAGSETVTWGASSLVIAIQSGVSTVAQILAATPTGTPWATLASVAAAAVVSLASTAMSALNSYTAGAYTIEVNNLDTVFFNLIGIDRIELLPIPACTTGCFNANRIFFSGVQDATLDDASKNNIFYSNYAGTKYAFQYNPLNFVDTGRDGQNMIKLITFEKDVIGLKESKTGRIPSGNVDLPWQELDGKTGIAHINLAAFIPAIGIVAFTSDYGDFKIFGYDLRWSSVLNGIDISKPIRSFSFNTYGDNITFVYINGKLIIYKSSGGGGCLVLHVKEKKGWTVYTFLSNGGRLFTFGSGLRAAFVAASTHLVEIEVLAQNGDVLSGDDSQSTAISASLTTGLFSKDAGKKIIEMEYLSIKASFNPAIVTTCFLYINQASWPDPSTPTVSYLTPPTTLSQTYSVLAEREYKLFVQPGTVGTLKWCPPVGNFIHFLFYFQSPATIKELELACIIDEDGMGYGAFDPFNQFPTTNTDPTWAQ